MKIAFVYAGQGSQKVGMGKDLYAEYPIYKELIDNMPNADEIKDITFYGPAEKLAQTIHTQPCMVAFAVGVTQLLYSRGIRPEVTAGLSLGEYSALCAVGAFTPWQAMEIVSFRAVAMAQASKGIDTKMCAVLGADIDMLKKACEEAKPFGIAEIANINCPGQVVLSGGRAAVEKVEEIVTKAGAKRCMELAVSGPFHTSLMRPAGEKLQQKLAEEDISEMTIPVVFNTSGDVLQSGQSIEEMLVRQVQSSVLFEKSIRTMAGMGIDTIVEIGPGKTLSSFVRRIDSSIKCYAVEDVQSLENLVNSIDKSL